jgi:hypothetical protein
MYGFAGAVSFACSGLPADAACVFSPATIMGNGSKATTTMVVSAKAATESKTRKRGPLSPLIPGAAAIVLCGFGGRKRVRTKMLSMFALSVVGVSLMAGCGTPVESQKASGPPVTSMVTVTATSGTIQHTATLSLTVQVQ